MNLNLLKNIKNNIESNSGIQHFINELSNYLNKKENNNSNRNISEDTNIEVSNNIETYPKEGHLYLVTEDRNNIVYLWDFTEKSKEAFEETNLPKNLLNVATEGAMLKYVNGTYELYSEDGYDMVYNDENNKN